MQHRRIQWAPSRSKLVFMQTWLYRFCWTIVLAGLFLSAGSLLSPSAVAQGIPFPFALSGVQSVLAEKVTQAKAQVPPAVINRLRQVLSTRTKIPATKLKVIEAAAKTWTDGCLGLGEADEICTEALITGWRVVFSDGNQRWVYRSDQQAPSVTI